MVLVTKSMNSNKVEFTYKNSVYYGIFFPTAIEDTVIEIVRGTKYATLYTEGKVTKVGHHELVASANSDDKDPAWCFIMIDKMTFDGEDNDLLADASIAIDPTEMLNREKKFNLAVKALEEIYQIIVPELKKKGTKLDDVYFGWKAMCCTWEVEYSEEEPVKTPSKKEPAKSGVKLSTSKKTAKK